jgi:membrane protein implicated in regulation of membrane protease activity
VGLWIIWVIVAVILGVAEVMTTTLALGLVAIGALAAALAGGIGGNAVIQLAVFVVVSLAGVGLVRPVLMRRLHKRPALRTGTDALVGRTGLVLADVSPHSGRIRIGGEEWSARPYDETSVIPAGKTVDVLQIKGAMALVHPRD